MKILSSSMDIIFSCMEISVSCMEMENGKFMHAIFMPRFVHASNYSFQFRRVQLTPSPISKLQISLKLSWKLHAWKWYFHTSKWKYLPRMTFSPKYVHNFIHGSFTHEHFRANYHFHAWILHFHKWKFYFHAWKLHWHAWKWYLQACNFHATICHAWNLSYRNWQATN